MEEESVQPLKGLDVCIYYTLEEIMQNQSVFVSHAILGYMRVCFFFFFFFFCFVLFLLSNTTDVHPTAKWTKSCAPVFL